MILVTADTLRQAKFVLLLSLAITPLGDLFADTSQPACPSLNGEVLRWIVPTKPGGGYDAYSRLIQPFLEQKLAVQIRIENRPEAGGVVGALAIRDAPPDGRTLGIINASGLLAASAVEGSRAPDPAADYTVLGQVVSNQYFMFTGTASGITDINDLLTFAQSRPIIVGVRDAGSASFFSVPVMAELLGMDYELVSGYVGSAARQMALLRGEVDIIVGNFDSLSNQVRAGELIPLLQLTAAGDNRRDLPRLGGPEGMALLRSAESGWPPERAEQAADDLADIMEAGRLVVTPRNLPAALSECLETALGEVLQSADLLQAADRAQLSIDYQNSAVAYRGLAAGARGVDQFRDLISTTVKQVREQ